MDDNRIHIKDIKHQGENKNMTTIKKQFQQEIKRKED